MSQFLFTAGVPISCPNFGVPILVSHSWSPSLFLFTFLFMFTVLFSFSFSSTFTFVFLFKFTFSFWSPSLCPSFGVPFPFRCPSFGVPFCIPVSLYVWSPSFSVRVLESQFVFV